MKKLISVSDWFLLGVGKFLDVVEEIKDPLGLIKNYYSNIHGNVPERYEKHYYYQFIWRNLKTGNIEKKIVDGKVHLELTTKGKNRIKRRFPFLRMRNKKWDGMWRVVLFDIKEERRFFRDRLRSKLKELGFSQLQKSVWITPFDFLSDFQEYIESLGIDREVILLETEFLYVKDVKALAAKLWSLDKIHKKYLDIYKGLKFIKDNGKSIRNPDDRRKFLDSLKWKIVDLYFKDPFLPQELLPEDWIADKVMRLVKKMRIFSTD